MNDILGNVLSQSGESLIDEGDDDIDSSSFVFALLELKIAKSALSIIGSLVTFSITDFVQIDVRVQITDALTALSAYGHDKQGSHVSEMMQLQIMHADQVVDVNYVNGGKLTALMIQDIDPQRNMCVLSLKITV